MENRIRQVKILITELRAAISKPILKKLDLDKCDRVAEKLGTFSACCQDCQQSLLELRNELAQIKDHAESIDDSDLKQHENLIIHITSHLQKEHKLIHEGHYLAICMSLGMSLGVVFGLLVFDNLGLGIPIGMCIGLAIGIGLDEDAKKKGKTI